jgi:hypothetical protein
VWQVIGVCINCGKEAIDEREKGFSRSIHYIVVSLFLLSTPGASAQEPCECNADFDQDVALDYVSQMNAGINENYGYTNWKLPNLREIQSVIDYGQFDPALTPGHPFENVLFDNYWSSTTAGGITVYAWAVHIRNGIVERYFKTTDTLYVWPIRVRQ